MTEDPIPESSIGFSRPGPVRAARATAGRRQFLAMNSNEGLWSIGLISLSSFGRSMCVPVGRPMSHESAGEREYFRREVP